ncbi:hypothetical protein ABOC12_19765 [Acinetobacter baumannii]|uniref:hypothetical protein n=1 Tax=Acinetobacter baumannii TaxID=470 RepID=UPI0032DEF0E4
MLFSDYLDQHAVILALCLAICLSSVVVYTKYRTLRAVNRTGFVGDFLFKLGHLT